MIFDPTGKEMWSLTLTGETRLACGVGVGDPLARVKELFPGTATAAGSHEARSGQYLLSFWIGSGKVSRMSICAALGWKRCSGPAASSRPSASAAATKWRLQG